jgi:hypothetical protein
MSLDELWELHESVVKELNSKMLAERTKLEGRLHQLSRMPSDQVRTGSSRNPAAKARSKEKSAKRQGRRGNRPGG